MYGTGTEKIYIKYERGGKVPESTQNDRELGAALLLEQTGKEALFPALHPERFPSFASCPLLRASSSARMASSSVPMDAGERSGTEKD